MLLPIAGIRRHAARASIARKCRLMPLSKPQTAGRSTFAAPLGPAFVPATLSSEARKSRRRMATTTFVSTQPGSSAYSFPTTCEDSHALPDCRSVPDHVVWHGPRTDRLRSYGGNGGRHWRQVWRAAICRCRAAERCTNDHDGKSQNADIHNHGAKPQRHGLPCNDRRRFPTICRPSARSAGCSR